MKVCARCKDSKSLEYFSKNSQQKDGHHVYCKNCVNLYNGKYYSNNKEKIIERERIKRLNPNWSKEHKKYQRKYRSKFFNRIREARIIKLYGIDLKEWENLFNLQGRCCAICKTTNPGRKGWSTDHDHESKKVRGILCNSCNNGLGRFKDNIQSLLTAVEYLRGFKH